MTTKILEAGSEAIVGRISQVALVGLLRTLFVRRRSGRLVLSRAAENFALRLLDGNVVADNSDQPVGGFGEHVRGVFFDVFSWGSGFFKFDPEDGAAVAGGGPRVDPAPIILELINCLERPADVREALGDLSLPLAAVENPRVRLEGVTLSPTDAFVLSRADGTLTARELLQITPLSRETVERSLLSLLSVGVIECRRPLPDGMETPVRPTKATPPPEGPSAHQQVAETFAALSGRSHHEVLGVPATATGEELRAAYFRLSRRYHPDAVATAPPDVAAKAKAIFLRLDEAYSALRSAPPRPAVEAPPEKPAPPATTAPPPPTPAATPSALTPEETLHAAEAIFAERPWEALALLEPPIRQTSGPVQRQARLLQARVMMKSPSSQRAAEIELREVLQQDPTSIEALLLLASFYRDRGLVARAAGTFRRVLEISPGQRQAEAEIESLAGAAPRPAKFARAAAAA